jgi:hypothetical protein
MPAARATGFLGQHLAGQALHQVSTCPTQRPGHAWVSTCVQAGLCYCSSTCVCLGAHGAAVMANHLERIQLMQMLAQTISSRGKQVAASGQVKQQCKAY